MENSEQNIEFCMGLIHPFRFLHDQPKPENASGAVRYLAETLCGACISRDVARLVAEAVMEEETRFPAPATLRKKLDDMNYIQEDRARRQHEARKRENKQ